MKQLGRDRQVLAVTHLAQVAACGDAHQVVSKAVAANGRSASDVRPVVGEARTAEVARMLGGERLATSLAHAEQLLVQATAAAGAPEAKPKRGRK
jgi:DNA repair protein RecN (Recombination protein N)